MSNSFKALYDFFKELNQESLLMNDGKFPFIPISWLSSTESLNKDIIEETIMNIIRKTHSIKSDVNTIEGFTVIPGHSRLILQANTNGFNKLNITDNFSKNDLENRTKIQTISLNRFAREIVDLLKEKEFKEKCKEFLKSVYLLDFSNEEILEIINEQRKKFYERKEEIKDKEKEEILTELDDMFSNLLEYYKYLSEEKENNTLTCTVRQRMDHQTKTKSDNNNKTKGERKSEIIPFKDREKIITENNPTSKVYIDEIDKHGDVIPKSYAVHIFNKNLLSEIGQEQNGYLFIAEPFSGDRSTRIFFVSQEELTNTGREIDIKSTISKYMSMSNMEFRSEKNTTILAHTSIENYKDRINFYINGRNGKSLTNLKQYSESLRQLYNNNKIRTSILSTNNNRRHSNCR